MANASEKTAGKINYQTILRDVSMNLLQLKQPKRLLKLLIRFIDREIALSHITVLVLDESKKQFTIVQSRGKRKFPSGFLKIEERHPLVQWFRQAKQTIRPREHYIIRSKLIRETKLSGSEFNPEDQRSFIIKAMNLLGAELIVPAYERKKLVALLMLGKKRNKKPFTPSDIHFFQTLAHTCSIAIATANYHETLLLQNAELQIKVTEIGMWRENERKTYRQILRSLAQEVYAKDPYTFGHINQVERLGMMTAEELGLDLSGRNRDIISASLILHDIGKIGIPDHILLKPAKLDPEEWAIMKTHVDKGVKILEPLELFKEVADIIHCHHERFDGTGYPRGLMGCDIPVESRIISVVDAYHAIVSKRVYDAARPVDVAFKELRMGAGTQFDPDVVNAFISAQTRELAKRGALAGAFDDH